MKIKNRYLHNLFRENLEKEQYKEKILWAAGLIEGEGCIKSGYRKDKLWLACSISAASTDRDVIDKLYNCFKLGAIYDLKPKEKYHKFGWQWNVHKQEDVVKIIELIYPYMGIRRKSKMDKVLKILKERIAFNKKASTSCRVCGCKLENEINYTMSQATGKIKQKICDIHFKEYMRNNWLKSKKKKNAINN